jgi:mRNA-degrading endonuclease HigB of HigAB toxin-antitoxin module
MRIIALKTLRRFWEQHPDAQPKHGQSILYTSAEIIDCIP